RTALGALRRDVTDAPTARATGASSIGEQRHFGADRHSLQHARQRQHLAHTRATAGTLAADYHDFTGTNAVHAHRHRRRLFILEHPRRSAKGQLVLLDGADFDHRSTGSEIAEQHAQRATRRMWLRDRPNTLLV